MDTSGGTERFPVLITVRELDTGGIERDAVRIAIGLQNTRFPAHIASFRNFGIRFDEIQKHHVPFLYLPIQSVLSRTGVMSVVRLRQYVQEHGIRLVHAFDASASFAAPAARAIGVPIVLASQLGSRDLMDRRSRNWMRLTDRIVDKVIVNCEAMRRHLIEDEGVPASRIELCYNGVDPSEFYPNTRPKPTIEGAEGASLVVGTVCVLRPEKALHLLQEAFARVRHIGPRMKLLIVGSGPELPHLQRNSEALQIADDSVFLPATREVPRILHGIDIFVSSSSSEAFSNAVLEAMTSGCAVVGSRVGGTPELIGDNERGLLFTPGDANDLAAKLAMLIRDASMRSRLGSQAAEYARQTWSIGAAVKRMSQIYQSVLRSKDVQGAFRQA